MNFKAYVEMALQTRWTVRNIRSLFNVPTEIAIQIQGTFDADKAMEIAKAHKELCVEQVGF